MTIAGSVTWGHGEGMDVACSSVVRGLGVSVLVIGLAACGDDEKRANAADDAGAGGRGAGGRVGAGGAATAGGGARNTGDGGAPRDAGTGGAPAGGDSGATIGPAGGEVAGPGGARVVVPTGALGSSVAIRIAEDGAGAPSLPAGFVAVGPTLAFTPHGLTFTSAVTVTVPFDAAQVPPGRDPVLLKAEPGGVFAEIPATRDGAALTASVDGFSWMVAAVDQSRGELRVVIDGDGDIVGNGITTGPAGAVYVSGTTTADLDGEHPGGQQGACYLAKLTTTLRFEWVRQFNGCLARPAVGPTGNVYLTTYTAPPEMVQITSLNPSGEVRAGFPVDVGLSTPTIGGHYVQDLAVSSQDDVYVLGYRVATAQGGAFAMYTRSFLAVFTSSGQVQQALGDVDLGATGLEYDFPWSVALNNGLWVTADVEQRPSAMRGYSLQRFTPSGTVASGFPIRVMNDPEVQSAPIRLLPMPASEDVIAVGTGRGADQPPTLIRYLGTGAIAAGYPKPLATGSNKEFGTVVFGGDHADIDAQGNVYLVTWVDDPDANDAREYVLLSYTPDAALRAGYPVSVGTEATQPPYTASRILAVDVNETGSIYLAGDDAHGTVPGRKSLVLHRLPAR